MAKFDEYYINLQNSDEKGMLDLEAIKEYLIKAEKAICKIIIDEKVSYGSGFFCKIPYTKNNNVLLPVLLTCNHVLSSDSLKSQSIEIILEGKSKIIPLKQRKKLTNENMDFTCIEIKEEDNIHSFYNLDENVLDKNFSNEWYIEHAQKVLIFGINKNDKQVGFSNGVIKNNIKCCFTYNCNTYPGCSGGCIVNQYSNGVIGIHRGELPKEKEKPNIAVYIAEVIKYIKNNNQSLLSNVNH